MAEVKHFFSWGIFVDKQVRIEFYGRDNALSNDTLKGWSVENYKGQHFATQQYHGKIEGVVLELTPEELAKTDKLERNSGYKRVECLTNKGYSAALYVRDEELRP